MKEFIDDRGRRWALTINVAALKAVRDATGIHLGKSLDDGAKLLAEITGDPIALTDVIFALVRRQADTANVTAEDFAAAMSGDVMATAAQAFIDELINFFPNARARELMRKLLATGEKMQDAQLAKAEASIASISAGS